MRVITAIIGLSCFSTLAFADVSDDLKFCGARKSAPERLACFEAVTRGAAKPAAVRPVARAAPLDAQAAVPVKTVVLDPLPARNPFDGYYAAIGGGYGVGAGRRAEVFPGNLATFPYPTSMNSAAGGMGNLLLGKNIAIGPGIVGIEVDARFGGTSGVGTGSQLVFSPGFGNVPLSYRLHNDFGIHIATRAGLVFGDTLVFAKAGVGATHVRESFTYDQRQLVVSVRDPFTLQFTGTANAGLPLVSATTASWLPSAIFGVGLESNWGQFFARLSADVEVANHAGSQATLAGNVAKSSADQLLWTTRGTALFGVRF